MGLFFKTHQKHTVPRPHGKASRGAGSRLHICRIEQMEPRQLLSAVPAPIHIGATYFEDSNDFDTSSFLKGTTTPVADMFQVSYMGGAPGTELTSLTINLHDTCLFDTVAGGAGVGGAFPLKILSHDGFNLVDANGNEVSSVNVPDGATTLTLNFQNFNAGDKLVFSIDVNETIGLNAVAVGSEFVSQTIVIGGKTYIAQGATLDGTFTAPHMVDAAVSTDFINIDHEKNPGARVLHRRFKHPAAQRRLQQRCRQRLDAVELFTRLRLHGGRPRLRNANAPADHDCRHGLRGPQSRQDVPVPVGRCK